MYRIVPVVYRYYVPVLYRRYFLLLLSVHYSTIAGERFAANDDNGIHTYSTKSACAEL